jgi:hypothetical protein
MATGARRVAYWATIVATGVCVVSVVVVLFLRDFHGRTRSGTVPSPSELPFARELIAELQPIGPVHYVLRVSRRGFFMAVSGESSTPALDAFRQRHEVGSTSASDSRRIIRYDTDDASIEDDFAPYGQQVFFGTGTRGTLFFQEDCRFTLLLSGGETERRKAAELDQYGW